MKERSIRCTGEEVRAILAGRQKQLRRPVKLPCKYGSLAREWRPYDPARAEDREWMVLTRANPFGQPGDRLWVRETWARSTCSVFVGRKKISGGCVVYRADGAAREYLCEDNGEGDPCGLGRVVTPNIAPPVWRPSIHMPRWASRLTLEVLSVRVERLQDISEEDARAEGVERCPFVAGGPGEAPGGCECHLLDAPRPFACSFSEAWDAIYGRREGMSWADSLWVWVVTFKRLEAQHG